MPTSFILRRRKLGRTSAREIARNSITGIQVYRNDNRKYNYETNRYVRSPLPSADIVFRWGCTSQVPGNPVIINKAEAIHKVNDKMMFRQLTSDEGLAPKSWTHRNDLPFDNDEDFNAYGKKFVVRSRKHAQGRNLHVCNTWLELSSAMGRYGSGNYYISELINKVAEYRVCVIQGRVAWVARKTPGNPDQVAWNVAQGGRFDNVQWGEWPLKVIKYAVKAFNLSGLDFGGVDVMVDADGNPYVLEINSAMSLTSPYRQQATAKCFDWIINNGRNHIPLVEELGGWRKFIHPALSSEAILV